MATTKQLDYANALLGWHDDRGTLEDVILDLKPDLGENEDISDWFKRLSTEEMSKVITNFKDDLRVKEKK
jgi:hypothetical protein